MADLFTTAPAGPLAERLRPRTLDEVVGQSHLLASGKPLRLMFEARKLHSFILWGPPGVGKTTIARLAASITDSEFISLSAVLAGVKEIRAVVESARSRLGMHGRSTVLFIDEIHRFNKAQQDVLLPHVEEGLLVLVGGTTENPAFSVNSALLSRAAVYVLQPLSVDELRLLYERARPHLEGIELEPQALELLAGLADGDGRRFVNLLEQVCTGARAAGHRTVTADFARQATSALLLRFGTDELYDQISAFQKSIRGSAPDAALYWLARMLEAGADATYIARRLIVIASEDIGNADPRALEIAINAAQAYERLGSPEGDRALAHATVYLAVAAKSNAVYKAWNAARAFVRATGSKPVPLHLRNAPAPVLRELGHHAEYRYAHDEPDAYAAGESYFPDDLADQVWYEPSPRGLEPKIAEKLSRLRELDEASPRRRRKKRPA